MQRRNLVGGGMLAGAAALLGGAEPAAAAKSDDSDAAAARAIENLKALLERQLAISPELERIREQQRVYLKSNHKFPDFIEIGIDVWESVYDWHVRHQQPITAARTGGWPIRDDGDVHGAHSAAGAGQLVRRLRVRRQMTGAGGPEGPRWIRSDRSD